MKARKTTMKINRKKGFTIIEVVLVLAIAGLIFLMVFIALPALNRGQRNTQRKNDMARFLSQMTQFKSNNNGKMPLTLDTSDGRNSKFDKNFAKKYMDSNCSVPTADANTLTFTGCQDGFTDPDGKIYSIATDGFNHGEGTDASGPVYPGVMPTADISAGKVNHVIYTVAKAQCDGDKVKAAKGKGDIAILYILEGGAIYCGDTSN